MDLKLQEVMAGSAAEYLEPLATLQENMQIRTKVAGQLMLGLYIIYTPYDTADVVYRDYNHHANV